MQRNSANQCGTLVSVVIPCFNVQNYIGECLDSVRSQTHTEIEIICVDDGSTDDTPDILRAYGNDIRLIESDHHGATFARNLGLASAKGEFVQFLDSDDLLLPGKIAHQAELLRNNPGTSFVAGKYRRMLSGGEFVESELGNGDPWACLIQTKLGITSANFWRKSALDTVGGWDERAKSSQEARLMFRLLQRGGEVIFDPAVFAIVRERDSGSIRTKNRVRYSIRYMKLRMDILDFLKETDQLTQDRMEAIGIAMLGSTRHLGNIDNRLSMMFYRKHLEGWLNLENNSQLNPLYRKSIRIAGFQLTERVARIARVVFKIENN